MLAKEIMTTDVATATPEQSIHDVAEQLLERSVSALPVVDDQDRLVGIISEGDLLRRVETGTERKQSWWLDMLVSSEEKSRDFLKSHAVHVRDVMTREIISVEEDTPASEIAGILEENRIKRVPVLRGETLVGIVSRADIIRALAVRHIPVSPRPQDDLALRDTVLKTIREIDGVSSTHVNVLVDDGVVHLWGLADSSEQKTALRVAVENIPEVTEVQNHLQLSRGLTDQPD
ncbi:MAG: CBS domain-containing protein [Alphaproteobacteria bacterium]|nr:CBS domain-containing protein [Alphaproteobacteria bacterium]